jgi:EAL domain-containing protein (putative c-di-GMP-specific phosphodiesterase class I)/GGDEF domain-containing protein
MSLSKQLLILISILFLLIFGVNLTLSINNTKTYLENESLTHAQDTATSLGLSLSPYMKFPQDPTVQAMISAVFDMGYYQEIRLIDPSGRELIALKNYNRPEGIPSWFIRLLHISPATAQSEISSGWTISGTVFVTVNPSYGYSSIYKLAKTSLYYSFLALSASIFALTLLLNWTLASLKNMRHLARKIAEGHFEQLDTLPWTSDIKTLAIAMNSMSFKIQNTIQSLHSKLESTSDKLLRDPLTGLYNKSLFDSDINHLQQTHSAAFLLLIKVDSLPELIKEQGSDNIDKLLQEFAAQIQNQTQKSSRVNRAYRLYGGEFAMLIETNDLSTIKTLCDTLSHEISALGRQFGKPDIAHIGVSQINLLETPERIKTAAQEAYEQACLISANAYYINCAGNHIAKDVADWKKLVFDCIDNAYYTIACKNPVTALNNSQIIMEEVLTEVFDRQNQPIALGPFISIAEKYPKIIDFDKGVITKVLDYLHGSNIDYALAVNLSNRSIKNTAFMNWLEAMAKQNPRLMQQLVFSFSAYAISKDPDAHVSFFYTLHQWNGRVMIKRFEPQAMLYEIHTLIRPDFIRLARNIGNGIIQSRKKQEYVKTVVEMCQLLDISVLAENIQSDEDCHTLHHIGIVGVSRI